MKLSRFALLVAGTALAAGCDVNSGGTPTVNPPLAYVRYVNAVSDVNTIDMRFIDKVEGSGNYTNIQYRQYTPYMGIDAGTRPIRTFVSPLPYALIASPSRQQIITQTVIAEGTFTFAAGKYYTIYHVGQTGLVFITPTPPDGSTGAVPTGSVTAGGAPLRVVEDVFPTVTNPPAASVFVRSVNLGQAASAISGLGDQNIFVGRETDALLTNPGGLNGTAWMGVPAYPAAGSITPYVVLSPRPAAAAAVLPALQASTYRWSTAAPALPLAPVAQLQSYVIGLAGSTTTNGTGGAQVSGSVMTALIYPRSVLGSAGPQTAASGPVPAFTAPSVFVIVDRSPPRTAP